ncbi:expressed unknown protein [Seminavis robusta]|uniref:Uncharacterized protein n=1 Tax=Seminavis robusta TaxID=568900 RepID=A0A9N8HNP0_9STRA|nr:expressed unknown protein [Seminavis robusta]|eukprot:Sro1012_g231240.1 n/a (575) ;mRNA; f:31433-33157
MPKTPRALRRRGLQEGWDGVYDWTSEIGTNHRRPLPSSNQMILSVTASAVAEANRELPPVVKAFLAATGHDDAGTQRNDSEGDNNENAQEGSSVATIDNPQLSTLTSGQHQRYMKIVATGNRQTGQGVQKKDYRKLFALVEAEQQLYRQALVEFWETNRERVLIGFSSSTQSSLAGKFVQLAANLTLQQTAWRNRLKDTKFGKYCQVISPQTPGHSSSGKTAAATWLIDGIQSHKVVVDKADGMDQMLLLPDTGRQVPLPKPECSLNFLDQDQETLVKIATSNKASIVATLEALETMINFEGRQLVLPISCVNGVALVDSPLPPSFSNPRDCLTQGLNQGLEQWQDLHGRSNQQHVQGFRYMILQVPQVSGATGSARTTKQTRVLVRLPRQSTRAHAHVEYFPERKGEEVCSALERSLWILDHYLFSRSVVAKIDPTSCRVLKWEETGLAHALSGMEDGTAHSLLSSSRSCIDHWHAFAQIIQAITTIGQKGKFMLCSPGRGPNLSTRSISVHMETTKGDGDLDIESDIGRAGEVKLGAEAMGSCMREWAWKYERVPFTFPLPAQDSQSEQKRN